MSKLKYDLRALLPSFNEKIRTISDRQIKKRFYFIRKIVKSKRSIERTCEQQGISRDQFYFWAKRLLQSKDLTSLKDRSKKPVNSPRKHQVTLKSILRT